MKCKVCGAESGKYPLCKECYRKKEAGTIVKCPKCQQWHEPDKSCAGEASDTEEKFLYELKASLVTKTEMDYLDGIKKVLPENCLVQAQANLASFIRKTDGSRFQNELYRNVDFIITDLSYRPLIVIEINDQTHLTEERRARDRKVGLICEEAGIPVIKLWTSYGVNLEYIQKRITETLSALPVKRVPHFVKETEAEKETETQKTVLPPQTQEVLPEKKKKGCYIATCVYGSYDCPQVWILRRFRDDILEKSRLGRGFVAFYYAVSPALVRLLGGRKGFRVLGRKCLDILVYRLLKKGVKDIPYTDPE